MNASERKKKPEKETNHKEIGTLNITIPESILNVYKNDKVRQSIITILLRTNEYKVVTTK